MYIRPPKKRSSSPVRVLILLVLIGVGIYILVWRRDIINPIQIGPTPTPTPTAGDVMAEAEALYLQGELDEALDKYWRAAELDPEDALPLVWASHILTLRGRTGEAVETARVRLRSLWVGSR